MTHREDTVMIYAKNSKARDFEYSEFWLLVQTESLPIQFPDLITFTTRSRNQVQLIFFPLSGCSHATSRQMLEHFPQPPESLPWISLKIFPSSEFLQHLKPSQHSIIPQPYIFFTILPFNFKLTFIPFGSPRVSSIVAKKSHIMGTY